MGHTSNIFGSRFLGSDALVTCAGDGQARVADLERECVTRIFQVANARAKKLVVELGNPHHFWVCAEDGLVRLYDLRLAATGDEAGRAVVRFGSGTRPRGLSSLSLARRRPEYLAVAGDAPYVWVLDRRKAGDGDTYAVEARCTAPGVGGAACDAEHVTGVCLDEFAERLAASYSGGPVQVFDVRGTAHATEEAAPEPEDASAPSSPDPTMAAELLQDLEGTAEPPLRRPRLRSSERLPLAEPAELAEPLARCGGHVNVRTVKDVQFLGPGHGFLGSGSDDGRLFIWACPRSASKRPWSCELRYVGTADSHVVNCVASHPRDPVLAVSGIDSDVKLLGPASDGVGDGLRGEHLAAALAQNERRERMSGISGSQLLRLLRSLRRSHASDSDDDEEFDNDAEDPDCRAQ